MTSNNCLNCKYSNDGFCAVNPVHYSAWTDLQNSDDFDLTKKSVKVSDKSLDECAHFETQVEIAVPTNLVTQKRTKLKRLLANPYIISGLAGCTVFSYINTSNLPPYQNNSFPYHLSEETRLAIPKCSAIFHSLEPELTRKGRFFKLSQLDGCLKKTPLYPHHEKDVLRIIKHYKLAADQPESLDVRKLDSEYETLLLDLNQPFLGISYLEDYRINFAFMFIFTSITLIFLFAAATILLVVLLYQLEYYFWS